MATTYILVERTPDGNGLRDWENEIAVSTDREALEKYCETTIGSKLNDRSDFWAKYYEIKTSSIVVLPDMKAFPTDKDIQEEIRDYWFPSMDANHFDEYERGFESGCEFVKDKLL